jgi:TatD DNase family protein
MVKMLDTHCHLDLYPDPSRIALNAESAGVFVVCVTNLPSAFLAAQPHVRRFKSVRLALGLHPLIADLHSDEELSQFSKLVCQTSFIGEIGLDFSREGQLTKERQLVSFRFALQALQKQPKFVTIHSRQAETAVLEVLREEYPHPVVFHWYSGKLKHLENAIAGGHFFSINPAMIRSQRGKEIIARIPREKVLTESDGPFIKMRSRTVEPTDVYMVEEALGKMWNAGASSVRSIVRKNFQTLIEPLKNAAPVQSAEPIAT